MRWSNSFNQHVALVCICHSKMKIGRGRKSLLHVPSWLCLITSIYLVSSEVNQCDLTEMDAAHWWWLRRPPPPFYVKHFEYPEKRSINYYYYLYCQWSPLLIQYAHSVRLEAALHNTPQKLDWQKTCRHWSLVHFYSRSTFYIFFFQFTLTVPNQQQQTCLTGFIESLYCPLSVLVFAVWIFWVLFFRPWNVWEVTYCNLVTICIGLGLSMQCKLAFKEDTSENTLKW